ncbi:MAG: hypothetical protein Q4C30_09895 [Bacteroidia bacterium]|nr:hypothetical protein [Bacteroidia bacterium]
MNYPDLVRKLFADGKVRYYETISSGFSMFPTIWPKSDLKAEYVPLRDIKEGDIVIFQRGDRLVAHRVVKVGEEYLRSRGDSCLYLDEVVDASNYLCKVVSYVLWKRVEVREDSLYWKVQRWIFLHLRGAHKINHYFVLLLVKIVVMLGIHSKR